MVTRDGAKPHGNSGLPSTEPRVRRVAFTVVEPVALRDGLWRWTAPHPDWRPRTARDNPDDWPRDVGCVLYETAGDAVFIDPLLNTDAAAFWRWADERCRGREVFVLETIRFHRRSRDALVERYGASTSRAKRNLPSGVDSIPIRGAGETMFWLAEHGALVPGDRILGGGGQQLRPCPESWLRYRPRSVSASELADLLRPLLKLPIQLVLCSHGEPVLTDAHAALARALG